MRRALLDTSAYSAFVRGNRELLDAVQLAEVVFLSPIILGELLAGFRKGSREVENRRRLEDFLDSPAVGLVTVGEDTAERYGEIFDALRRAGTPIPTNDIWIAASAMEHGLVLLTTDGHFRDVPQISARIFAPVP